MWQLGGHEDEEVDRDDLEAEYEADLQEREKDGDAADGGLGRENHGNGHIDASDRYDESPTVTNQKRYKPRRGSNRVSPNKSMMKYAMPQMRKQAETSTPNQAATSLAESVARRIAAEHTSASSASERDESVDESSLDAEEAGEAEEAEERRMHHRNRRLEHLSTKTVRLFAGHKIVSAPVYGDSEANESAHMSASMSGTWRSQFMQQQQTGQLGADGWQDKSSSRVRSDYGGGVNGSLKNLLSHADDLDHDPADIDGDGEVDDEEEARMTRKLRQIYTRADRDGDGEVDREELILAVGEDEELRVMLGLPARLRFADRSRDQIELMFQAADANDDKGLEFSEFAAMCRKPRQTILRGQLRRRNQLRASALTEDQASQDRGQLRAEGKTVGEQQLRTTSAAQESQHSLHELSLGFSFNASATATSMNGAGARIVRGNADSFSSTAPINSTALSAASAAASMSNTHSGSFFTTLDSSTMDTRARSTSPISSPTKSVRVRGVWDDEEDEEEQYDVSSTYGSLASSHEQRIQTKWRRQERVGDTKDPSRRLAPAAYGRSVHEKLVAFYRRFDPMKLSKEHIVGELKRFGLGEPTHDEDHGAPNGVTRSGGLRALNAELQRLYGTDLNTRGKAGGRMSSKKMAGVDLRMSTGSIGAFSAMGATGASMANSVKSTADMHKELRQEDASRKRNMHSSLQPLLKEISRMQVSVLVEVDSTMRQAGQLDMQYSSINIDKTLTTYFVEMFDQDGSIHAGSGNGPIRQRLRDFISNLVKLVEEAGLAWKRVHHELVRENNRRRHKRKGDKWGLAKKAIVSKLDAGGKGRKGSVAFGFIDMAQVGVGESGQLEHAKHSLPLSYSNVTLACNTLRMPPPPLPPLLTPQAAQAAKAKGKGVKADDTEGRGSAENSSGRGRRNTRLSLARAVGSVPTPPASPKSKREGRKSLFSSVGKVYGSPARRVRKRTAGEKKDRRQHDSEDGGTENDDPRSPQSDKSDWSDNPHSPQSDKSDRDSTDDGGMNFSSVRAGEAEYSDYTDSEPSDQEVPEEESGSRRGSPTVSKRKMQQKTNKKGGSPDRRSRSVFARRKGGDDNSGSGSDSGHENVKGAGEGLTRTTSRQRMKSDRSKDKGKGGGKSKPSSAGLHRVTTAQFKHANTTVVSEELMQDRASHECYSTAKPWRYSRAEQLQSYRLWQHCQLFTILCDGGHRMRELISEDFGEELELYFGSADFLGRIDKILHFNQLAIECLESITGMCTSHVQHVADSNTESAGGEMKGGTRPTPKKPNPVLESSTKARR
jgi:hypothetical protein